MNTPPRNKHEYNGGETFLAEGINILTVIGLGLVFSAVVVGVGADILSSLRDNYGSETTAYLTINNGSDGLNNLAKQMPTVGTVGGAIAILGLVMTIGK